MPTHNFGLPPLSGMTLYFKDDNGEMHEVAQIDHIEEFIAPESAESSPYYELHPHLFNTEEVTLTGTFKLNKKVLLKAEKKARRAFKLVHIYFHTKKRRIKKKCVKEFLRCGGIK